MLEELRIVAVHDSDRGYMSFLPHVVIDAQPNKRPFRMIAESWQYERAHRTSAALDNLAGITKRYDGPRSFWNGYHKGSDKTHDDARELLWLMGWSKRRLNCYICAGSEDQAALITDAAHGIIQDNEWIGERVRLTKLTGESLTNGSKLQVLPMNAWTGQGIFPDYVIASEVTHWQYDDGKRFWEFILESVNKRPHCVLKVETNAGLKGTWQWDERNRIEKSKFWSFFEAPEGKPLPTWMNQEKIDDDSQGLTPGERDRLYKNRWVDPGEEHGYLTQAECLLCRDYLLEEKTHGDRWTQYYAVLDYGGVNDRTALGIMHLEPPATAVVDRLDCWQGTHEERVGIISGSNVRNVQDWIETVRKHFNLTAIIGDPYQLEGLLIHYERIGIRVLRFEYRGGKANYRMAQILKTCVQNRLVRWSQYAGRLPTQYVENGRVRRIEDQTLEQELAMLITKPTQFGYRFDHESGRHDDRSCVLGMGLLHAFPEGVPLSVGPLVVPDPHKLQPVLGPQTMTDPNDPHKQLRIDTPDSIGRWRLFGAGGGSKWDNGDID